MNQPQEDVINGTQQDLDGKPSVYYDGYWIRRYDPRSGSLVEKKALIDSLTKRVFHHTERGINTPACMLNQARRAYDGEDEPARKRVNAAMLAGALLHRAADIFTKLVELEQSGVEITPQNDLVRECGRCYLEASELAKHVRHYSGEEGLDELWGEPFKVFSMPIEQFYEGRYIKVAQAMAVIDEITEKVVNAFSRFQGFEGFAEVAFCFAEAAKLESETSKSDPVNFEVWPQFVATGDRFYHFQPERVAHLSESQQWLAAKSIRLIHQAKKLLTYTATARVPMPKSTRDYYAKLDTHIAIMHEMFPRNRSAYP